MKKQSLVPWGLALVGLAVALSVDPTNVALVTSSDAITSNATLKKPFAALFDDPSYDPSYDTSLILRSPERERSKLCVDLEERDIPSKEEYGTIIGPWLEKTLQQWRADNPDHSSLGGLGFLNYLTSRYAPDVTAHTRTCDLSGACFVPTCGDYSDDFNLQELVMAFWSIESMYNLHDGYTTRLKVNLEAFDTIRPDHFVSEYSDFENHKAHQATVELKQKLGLSIGLAAALVLSSFVPPAAGVIGGAQGLVNEALKDYKATANMWGSAVAGLYSGLNSIGSHGITIRAGKPAEVKNQVVEQMRQASKDRFEYTQNIVRGDLESLLSGSADNTTSNIAAHVKTGAWADKKMADVSYVAVAKNVWFATYLGMIWKAERTYIVMSDVSSGSCATDNRGPSKLKVCLDEYPGNVFYIYFLPRVREGTLGKALLRGPPGWQRLEEETDIVIGLKDVVQSSVYSYKIHGNKPPSGSKSKKPVQDEVSSLLSSGGRFNGFFHIPVCYTPHGEAISSVNEKKSRNFPCMCGPGGWSHYDHSTDETYDFLEASGLYQSGDWKNGCNSKWHSNHCHRKHSVNFPPFSAGKNRAHHPFKKCKSKSHEHKGCETSKGNGWKKQGDC